MRLCLKGKKERGLGKKGEEGGSDSGALVKRHRHAVTQAGNTVVAKAVGTRKGQFQASSSTLLHLLTQTLHKT